jgi:hypothetical protein
MLLDISGLMHEWHHNNSNLESLLTQQYVCVNVHSDLIIHAFLLVFIAQIRSLSGALLPVLFECMLSVSLHFYVSIHSLSYFSKEKVYTSEGYRMFAFLSIDVKRDLIGCLG